eukprot:TRINITY_DN37335_c0_g1_i1.p1 TRINITY_DN37335_c0_g1~~TRINITY_DN37335_c0_g1_i1.p1  ORF type:complete len:513 (+),score=57.58 TRINITY_DN37335_c0_g1_i1:105-1643(+)
MARRRHVIFAVSLFAGILLVFGGGLFDFKGSEIETEKYHHTDAHPKSEGKAERAVKPVIVNKLIDKTNQPQSTSELSDCYQLETIPNFKAIMCYSSTSCSGKLSITRQDCETDTNYARAISNNETTNEFLRRNYGPDWYRVRFWGPEVVVADPQFVAGTSCEYLHRFELTSKGEYNLAVELLYKNFDGIDEIRDIWPQLLKTNIIKQTGKRSAIQRETSFHQGQLTEDSDVTVKCESQPSTDADVGRWKLSSDKVLYTKVRSKKISRKPIVFQWLRQAHEDYRWSQKDDRRSESTNNGKVSILVTGDSQLRAAFFGLVNTLRGHQQDCVRNISSPDHNHEFLFPKEKNCLENVKGSHTHKIGRFSVFFTEDAFLSKCKPGGKYGGYSVIVLGFGQHPASRKHWPLAKYEHVLKEKVDCLQYYLKDGKKIKWLMAPKYPDTQKGFPVGVKDWRTDPRLFIFNNAARAALPKHDNLHIIEAFNMSVGMGHTSSDQAHYNNFVLAEFADLILQGL